MRHEAKHKTHSMRYSAAYPTGRELMLETWYGCAGALSKFKGYFFLIWVSPIEYSN